MKLSDKWLADKVDRLSGAKALDFKGAERQARTGCGKTRTMSFRRAGFARGICCFLEAEKKIRSLASLGMTKSTFSAACEDVIYKDYL
jgi:hypothetical protein